MRKVQYVNPNEIRDLSDQFKNTVMLNNQKQQLMDPMCFIDLEMTDTDPLVGKIAEIAVYLVSGDMRIQILICNFVIAVDLQDFKNQDVIQRFTKSGLWQDLQNPEKTVSLKEAEELIVRQFEEYGIMQSSIPSAGIQAYIDRIILERQMPALNKFLNFTIIDISSIDEVANRWNKRVFNKREAKENKLRAEPNARRAIQRLFFYKQNLFKTNERHNYY